MIFDALLYLGLTFLDWIVGLFPPSTGFGTEFHDAMETIGGYIDIFTPLIPTSTLVSLIGIVMGVEIGIFGFKTVKWIISHIPYVGGKGA